MARGDEFVTHDELIKALRARDRAIDVRTTALEQTFGIMQTAQLEHGHALSELATTTTTTKSMVENEAIPALRQLRRVLGLNGDMTEAAAEAVWRDTVVIVGKNRQHTRKAEIRRQFFEDIIGDLRLNGPTAQRFGQLIRWAAPAVGGVAVYKLLPWDQIVMVLNALARYLLRLL